MIKINIYLDKCSFYKKKHNHTFITNSIVKDQFNNIIIL